MRLTRERLDRAAEIVYRHMAPTPQYEWPLLSAATGTSTWVKHENATPTGAFKVRGGLVLMERLHREGIPAVVTASTGNHGQSLAYAGRALDVPVTVVVPVGNSPAKNAAMRGFGATVVEEGRDFQESRGVADRIATDTGALLIGPYLDDLVAGVATYADELLTAAPDLDVVLVPIGMGSGSNGVVAVRDLLGHPARVIGVVAERAPSYGLSWRAGRVVTTESADTIADGVACRAPDADALAGLVAGLDDVAEVAEADILPAMRLMYETTHHLPCPTGALALAAAMDRRESLSGKRIAVVLTSSNTDASRAAAALAS